MALHLRAMAIPFAHVHTPVTSDVVAMSSCFRFRAQLSA